MIYHFSKSGRRFSLLSNFLCSFRSSTAPIFELSVEGNETAVEEHKSLEIAYGKSGGVEVRRETSSKKLTVWKSNIFSASAAFTVLSISPITCLARLIKTASAVPFSAEKLMRNDYFPLQVCSTIKFYLVQSFQLEAWTLNIEREKFSLRLRSFLLDGNRWLNEWSSILAMSFEMPHS